MKKIFLALAAVAALAACSKTNAEYEQNVEIGFAPVVSNRTKAMQTTTTFPDEMFKVWGWYQQVEPGTTIADWQVNADDQQWYINEKTFLKKSDGLWGGATAYYWPKLGSLMFAGYYPVSVAAKVNYEFTSEKNVMTIFDYTPGFVTKNPDHEEDLMYFNMTGSSQRNTEVSVTFRHALSWIDVILVKDADTSEEAFITVNSVTFKNILPTGDATVNNSAINGANTIQWGAKGAAADVVVTEAEGHLLVPGNTTPLEKQPLFIPQAMTKMVVNYTIASRDGSKFTETKEIELAGLSAGQSKWLPGKKYTYVITIGTSEILIKPTVTEWDNINVPVGI